MHTDNLKAWTEKLRDPDLRQIQGGLVKNTDADGVGFCCLGVGCVVAGMDADPEDEVIRLDGEPYAALPPVTFRHWLGLLEDSEESTADVVPDWDFQTLDGQEVYHITCANLNDAWLLTFSQIADILDYFGIRA